MPELNKHRRIFDLVRQYRNILTHSLAPIKLIENGEMLIPKVGHISEYSRLRWSSDRKHVNRSHYAPAISVIRELLKNLTANLNDHFWNVLQAKLAEIRPEAETNTLELLMTRIPYEESGGMMMGYDGPYIYSGERVDDESE